LRNAFPDRFGDLTPDEYLRLIYGRTTRMYFSGFPVQLTD
jgi:hypothetical protein